MITNETNEYLKARFGLEFPTGLRYDHMSPGMRQLATIVADDARRLAKARTDLRLLIRRTREDAEYLSGCLDDCEQLYEPLERHSLTSLARLINEQERRLQPLLQALVDLAN